MMKWMLQANNKMNNYLSLLLCVSVPYVSSVHAMSDCSKGNNVQEVNECAEKNKTESELNLNTEYKAAKTRIEQIYKGHDQESSQYRSAFIDTQRNWLKYRDSQCGLEAYDAEKGSDAYVSVMNFCIDRLDKERTAILKQLPY
nr:lysozyme inhibitor LprI family protein [Pantoea allii]